MFQFLAPVAWLLLAATPPDSITIDGQTAYRVQSPVVHDADTLTDGVIVLPFGAAIARRKIRSDYDAWEVRRGRQTVTITDAEIARGKRAAEELRTMLQSSTLYVAPIPRSQDIDPYDRIDSKWFIRSPDGKVRAAADVAREAGWLRGAK